MRVELVFLQYNISDSQGLFWFTKTKAFVLVKLFLWKKRVYLFLFVRLFENALNI